MAYSSERKAVVLAKMRLPNSRLLNRLAVVDGCRGAPLGRRAELSLFLHRLARWRRRAGGRGKIAVGAVTVRLEPGTSAERIASVMRALA